MRRGLGLYLEITAKVPAVGSRAYIRVQIYVWWRYFFKTRDHEDFLTYSGLTICEPSTLLESGELFTWWQL